MTQRPDPDSDDEQGEKKLNVDFEISKLSDIHGVLSDAAWMSGCTTPMKSMSVRLPIKLRKEADEICERNGTNLSVFLRQCVIALVNDYYNRNSSDGPDASSEVQEHSDRPEFHVEQGE